MRNIWTAGLSLALVSLTVLGCRGSGSGSASASASPTTAPAAAASPAASPAASDADRAFIDGMVPHHEMAVRMADDALAKATRQELKDFAVKVKADQGKEIAEMKTWRRAWFGSSNTPADQSMHGQATLPTGADYDRRWADEMVKHHQGAVLMAQTALAAATRPEVKAMAQRIIDAQQLEITQLQGWSRAWGK